MICDEIVKSVKKLKRRYREDNLFELCRNMGILLLPQPFGTQKGAIMGFFLEQRRIKTITYNSDLSDDLQRIIVGHELGHSVLHARSGVHAFHDVGLFDVSSRFEKEANLFAAEFLLDDDEVLETLAQGGDFFSAAAVLRVPMELLDFKFRIMKWKGYELSEPPITAQSNFLRDVDLISGQ